jgi:hypothetical protein
MKALSLIQPWATLIAIGAKRIETRSWSTEYRGPIAIHASKWLTPTGRIVSADVERCLALSHREPFCTELTMADIWTVSDLPSGALVATARLVDVVRTELITRSISDVERDFGEYSPGRFAWRLADVRRLPSPIPYRGLPGLWDLPDVALAVQTSAQPFTLEG